MVSPRTGARAFEIGAEYLGPVVAGSTERYRARPIAVNTAQDPPSTTRSRRTAACVLIVVVTLLGLDAGVAASPVSPSGHASGTALFEGVVESSPASASRPTAARENGRSGGNRRSAEGAHTRRGVPTVDHRVSRLLRHSPPAWRAPRVLLI